ncbi:hypothetical protein G9A89_009438 [Geosiphon pyriformis]|nr:hypothetical protein G9A89_009438 [Geosiphon pyriformis]
MLWLITGYGLSQCGLSQVLRKDEDKNASFLHHKNLRQKITFRKFNLLILQQPFIMSLKIALMILFVLFGVLFTITAAMPLVPYYPRPPCGGPPYGGPPYIDNYRGKICISPDFNLLADGN